MKIKAYKIIKHNDKYWSGRGWKQCILAHFVLKESASKRIIGLNKPSLTPALAIVLQILIVSNPILTRWLGSIHPWSSHRIRPLQSYNHITSHVMNVRWNRLERSMACAYYIPKVQKTNGSALIFCKYFFITVFFRNFVYDNHVRLFVMFWFSILK